MASGVAVELRSEGSDVTARRFRYMAEQFSDERMLETNHMVVKAMEEYHRARWGRGVKDLPQTAIRWPDAQGPLWNTGRLRASMTESNASGAIRRVTPYSITYGTSVFYGKFVNDGTKFMRPKPFLSFDGPLKVVVRNVFYERLTLSGGSLAGFPSPGNAARE